MNWTKAKNILIILFLVINIILLTIIINTMSAEKKNKQLNEYTRTILKKRNFDILCDIPQENPKMATMRYSTKSGSILFDKYTISDSDSDFDFKINSDESTIWKAIKKASINKKIPLNQYVFDRKYTSNKENIFLYNQEFDDETIFDNSVRVVVYSDKANVEIKYSDMEYIEEKRETSNISGILLKNFLESQKRMSIINIEAGYIQKREKAKAEDVLYIPAWRIITSDDKTRYYKAFAGDEIIKRQYN